MKISFLPRTVLAKCAAVLTLLFLLSLAVFFICKLFGLVTFQDPWWGLALWEIPAFILSLTAFFKKERTVSLYISVIISFLVLGAFAGEIFGFIIGMLSVNFIPNSRWYDTAPIGSYIGLLLGSVCGIAIALKMIWRKGNMSTPAMPVRLDSYMKGKTRHLFWLVLALAVLQSVISCLVNFAGMDLQFLHSSAAIVNLLAYLIWIALFILYGLCSRIKLYRVLFIVLAVFQLLILPGIILTPAPAFIDTIALEFGLLYISIYWIAMLLIIALCRPASASLRAAAIVTVIYILAFIAQNWYLAITENNIGLAIGIVHSVLKAGVLAFFFAAMSYSKPKAPKPVTPIAPQA